MYLSLARGRYIEKMVDLYKQMFKEKQLSKAKSPLNSNDHLTNCSESWLQV
jgi:hypothetical protein